jgi:hypothetical protein
MPAAAAAVGSAVPNAASMAAGVDPGPTGSRPKTPSATKARATAEGPLGSPKPRSTTQARNRPRAVTATSSATI